MRGKLVEATNGPAGPVNWGKFLVMRGPHRIVVFDLQTMEGAIFRPGGVASADLNKHRIHVCPLFEPFLEWLYDQELGDLDALPAHVELLDAPAALWGYRRSGAA